MESIRQLNLRLDRVIVENVDWQKCVKDYDRPETFFFIDPPYTDCDAGMYSAWHISDIKKLKERLDTLRGRWMVTLNDSVPIRQIFADCDIKSIVRAKGIGGKGKPYREVIITPQEAV